jgi:hypothetical protein
MTYRKGTTHHQHSGHVSTVLLSLGHFKPNSFLKRRPLTDTYLFLVLPLALKRGPHHSSAGLNVHVTCMHTLPIRLYCNSLQIKLSDKVHIITAGLTGITRVMLIFSQKASRSSLLTAGKDQLYLVASSVRPANCSSLKRLRLFPSGCGLS